MEKAIGCTAQPMAFLFRLKRLGYSLFSPASWKKGSTVPVSLIVSG